ncbi:MAG: 5'-methylthioadenosine/adenosylhomocysteine nucleosidase [Firmicutes bacterium]|nr:5'-methylthioadenosine/adenosylhomocysteine nucleosidase [Bacillota bacterium]
MTAIIGAMEIEVAALRTQLQNAKNLTCGNLTVTQGTLHDKLVAVCRCGIGKAASAAAAAFIISRFKNVRLLISLGVAGGVCPELRQGDFVLASASVQHDYDQTPDGLAIGQMADYPSREFPSCPQAVSKMSRVLFDMGARYKTGVIASGDQFIQSKQKAAWLHTEFSALACDMETAAIAQVCAMFGKKFVGLRAISDNADGSAVEDFYAFAKKAAALSLTAVINFINLMDNGIENHKV